MPLAETVARSSSFHQPAHVVSVRAGDATVLMDRKGGTYFTLNEVGGRVWELVGAGATVSGMVDRLLEEYEVSREQLEADVATTVRQLASDGLLARGPRPAPGSLPEMQGPKPTRRTVVSNREFRVPSVLQCGLTILAVKAMLKTLGFGWTVEWVRRGVKGVPIRGDVVLETVKAAEYRVAMAGALYPGRAKCLEQSLALYYLLRRSGIAVRFRMGVQPFPFLAHAWLEYLGEPITDVKEHVEWFTPLAVFLP